MTEPDAKSPNTKIIVAVAAVGVAILGVVAMALRPPADSGKLETHAGSGEAAIETHAATSPPSAAAAAPADREKAHAPSPSDSPGAAARAAPTVAEITSGAPVDMAQLLHEAKTVEAARTALASVNAKQALKELDAYDKIPNASSLRQEATLLKIEALMQVGRKADARALAYSTRDDPSFNSYQGRIDMLLENDAGR
jgi:cytoskeletal protein RodZ